MPAGHDLQIRVQTNEKETAAFAGHAETKAQHVSSMLIQRMDYEDHIEGMEISMCFRLSSLFFSCFSPCCRVPATARL